MIATATTGQPLSDILDEVEECHLHGRRMPRDRGSAIATLIARRHALAGAYANTFALASEERKSGFRLFTGERVTSAAARHIAGEECCRALRLLKAKEPAARRSLQEATTELAMRIGIATPPRAPKPDDGQLHWLWDYRGGTYCCGRCSVALWRNILAGSFDAAEARLGTGLRCLRTCRRGEGEWRVFPFWYTVLALVEMELPEAVDEMRYVAPRVERLLQRKAPQDRWSMRRHELATRVLSRV